MKIIDNLDAMEANLNNMKLEMQKSLRRYNAVSAAHIAMLKNRPKIQQMEDFLALCTRLFVYGQLGIEDKRYYSDVTKECPRLEGTWWRSSWQELSRSQREGDNAVFSAKHGVVRRFRTSKQAKHFAKTGEVIATSVDVKDIAKVLAEAGYEVRKV